MKYTREQLIEICEKGFVLQKDWSNRDSAMSQTQLGECLALLKADCEFEIQYTDGGEGCHTDERTVWIQFYVHDFMWFEVGEDEDPRGNASHDYHFYIPTMARLESCQGKDWY